MISNINLFVVEQHSINRLDSIISSIRAFKMHEAITPGATVLVGGDFARQDITESRKCIMKSLDILIRCTYTRAKCSKANFVVDTFVQVLDENVALTSFTKSGVTLRPHDPAEIRRNCEKIPDDKLAHVPCTVLDQRIIELFESSFT